MGITELLTPGEVARTFRVTPRQVTRWANQGKLRYVRTAGNHRRFFAAEVRAFLDGARPAPAAASRMADNHARIRQVECPRCGAAPLAICRDGRGHVTTIPHQARRSAAADAGIYKP